ncbi:MAG TPA: EAL domain-containing protein, partial [Acidisoma sp.]|nr:EAL domain-containing protein [Acidisoma sp.]
FADEHASRALWAAREAGFQVAMDDFGVGYSSLAQLPKLPLTSLKLDRAFLQRALESDEGVSLFATIVQLAHVLKLPVVAEGVETPAELAVASDCGCDSVQGFLFARPLSPTQMEHCLRHSAAHPDQLRLAWPPPATELA